MEHSQQGSEGPHWGGGCSSYPNCEMGPTSGAQPSQEPLSKA